MARAINPMDRENRDRCEEDEAELTYKSNTYNVCDPCRGRKIRCGRERPACANCNRAGQVCTWNGHGRKPSQSTAFKHAVAQIGRQLERMEQDVSKIHTILQRLHQSNSSTSLSSSSTSRNSEAAHSYSTCPAISDNCSSFITEESVPGETPWHGVGRHVLCITGDCETYHGPTSTYCLSRDVQELILSPMIQMHIIQKHQGDLFNARLEALLSTPTNSSRLDQGDKLPPAMPPLTILEAMIEPYFNHINPNFPLWSRQRLEQQISSHQGNQTACVVSANNVILLALTAKFTKAVSKEPRDFPAQQASHSMESELAGPFITNARRAANNINMLLTPNLANIQALLSLCLIAPYCLPEGILSQIFHQALYLSQLIGLSGRDPPTEDQDALRGVELQERQNVFGCLCTIATSINWATGIYAGNLVPDFCSLASTAPSILETGAFHWNAHISLGRIEQRTFKRLFALDQAIERPGIVCTCATELLEELDRWHIAYHGEPVSQELASSNQPDLTIKYHFLRAMLLHADRRIREASVQSIKASYDLIRVIVNALKSGSHLGYYSSLSFQLISYIPTTIVQLLLDLYETEDNGHGRENLDLELLRSLHSFFKATTALSHEESYSAQLGTFLDVLLDLAVTIHSPAKAMPSEIAKISQDAIFSTLPDFLRDSSSSSSASRTPSSSIFKNHSSHHWQGFKDSLSLEGVEDEEQIGSYLAMESGICDNVEGTDLWMSGFVE